MSELKSFFKISLKLNIVIGKIKSIEIHLGELEYQVLRYCGDDVYCDELEAKIDTLKSKLEKLQDKKRQLEVEIKKFIHD